MFPMILALLVASALPALAGENKLDFYLECMAGAECKELPYWDGGSKALRVNPVPVLSVPAEEISDTAVRKVGNDLVQVVLELRENAAKKFSLLTHANMGQLLIIVSEGRILLAPKMVAPIEDGRVVIDLAGAPASAFFQSLPWLGELEWAGEVRREKRRVLSLFAFAAFGLCFVGGVSYFAFFKKEKGA